MDTVTLWVCTDCYWEHHYPNGCEDDGPENPRPDSRLALARLDAEGWNVSAGLDSSQHEAPVCVSDYIDGISGAEECECETIPFSWSPCECCLSTLGGSRNALTLFPKEN